MKSFAEESLEALQQADRKKGGRNRIRLSQKERWQEPNTPFAIAICTSGPAGNSPDVYDIDVLAAGQSCERQGPGGSGISSVLSPAAEFRRRNITGLTGTQYFNASTKVSAALFAFPQNHPFENRGTQEWPIP